MPKKPPAIITTATESRQLDDPNIPTPTTDETRLDMRGDLTTPHTDPNNPFAFVPTQLAALMDPKNLNLLTAFGGIEGVARGLFVDLTTGLSPAAEIDSGISFQNEKHAFPKQNNMELRTAVFGLNVLPEPETKGILGLMWLAFKDKTLILLAVAAIVSLAVGLYEDIAVPEYDANGNKIAGVKWVEGVAIIVAIIIVVLVGSINDFQKERQFRKLNAKKEDRLIKATRESTIQMVSIHNIQVGDILHLEPGDIVAADGIFIEGHNLKCDESAATGESDAVRKLSYDACIQHTTKQDTLQLPFSQPRSSISSSSSATHVEDKAPSRSSPDPFIISGSKVIEGVATYIVTSVGVHSYHGRTMMALRTENEMTPLQVKLNGLAEMITKLGSGAAIVMLIVLLIRYFVGYRYYIPTEPTEIVQDIMSILIVVVTVIVVAVPEGLPLAVTLALAYATQRMLKDNNLVRVLASCETMGNATTVCSDKTGTLTQNKMTVVAASIGNFLRFARDTDEKEDEEDIQHVRDKTPKPVLDLLTQAIATNSTAFEGLDEKGEPSIVGNKTETALLTFSLDYGAEHFHSVRERYALEQVFPFSSDRKAMATVIRVEDDMLRGHFKGASEIMLDKCSQIVDGQDASGTRVNQRKLTADDRTQLEAVIQDYASRSLRTLAIAYRDFVHWPPAKATGSSADDDEVPYDDLVHDNGLTLIGIVGIEDPLRPGVKEAVKACQKAGVFVRMVTGDNVITAKSIAKQCEIYTSGGLVMEGPTFRHLSPAEMDAVLPRLQVLARSSPEDKRILVERLKELGETVAVTGDGTNDGPALKLADVGFSMGIAGTEVAKEASSIILMDDNFSSIVKAIMWGRCVNDAVRKFLEFQLTVNVTAVVLTFISGVASEKQKSVLTAIQLLWVNLIMDTLAALALATDPPTEELLDRAPTPKSAPLISLKMWKMIIGQAIFQVIVTFVLLYSNILDYDPEDVVLQTIVFNTFVFCQIFNEINCRRIDSKFNVFHNILSNKFFIIIFFLCVICQAIIVNFGDVAFQVTRIGGPQWAIAIVIGMFSLPVGALIRLIPDRWFGFLFRNPTTRQRYLGEAPLVPSLYMTGHSDDAVYTHNAKAEEKANVPITIVTPADETTP